MNPVKVLTHLRIVAIPTLQIIPHAHGTKPIPAVDWHLDPSQRTFWKCRTLSIYFVLSRIFMMDVKCWWRWWLAASSSVKPSSNHGSGEHKTVPLQRIFTPSLWALDPPWHSGSDHECWALIGQWGFTRLLIGGSVTWIPVTQLPWSNKFISFRTSSFYKTFKVNRGVRKHLEHQMTNQ